MTNDDTNEHSLLVSFEDQSPQYVNGFEAGQIWEEMNTGLDIEKPVHTENKTTLERMAVALGYDVTFVPTDYVEWIDMKATKSRPRLQGGNPSGLRIVK